MSATRACRPCPKAALSLLALFFAAGALDAQPAREQPRFGGVLKVAMNAEPPSLDLHWSPSVTTSRPMWHVFETLFTFDGDFKPIPLLAEGYTRADDGRRYTITLRKGVRFHNGKELTAADVVASLSRWGAMLGRSLWKSVEFGGRDGIPRDCDSPQGALRGSRPLARHDHGCTRHLSEGSHRGRRDRAAQAIHRHWAIPAR